MIMKERILAYETATRALTQQEIEAVTGGAFEMDGLGTGASPDSVSHGVADDCTSDMA